MIIVLNLKILMILIFILMFTLILILMIFIILMHLILTLMYINDFDNIKLNTSWHWVNRDECSECPVLQLCAGSCMFVEGEQWYHSCNNEYYYNIGILGGALFHLTGMVVTNVTGKIRRPNPQQYLDKELLQA